MRILSLWKKISTLGKIHNKYAKQLKKSLKYKKHKFADANSIFFKVDSFRLASS